MVQIDVSALNFVVGVLIPILVALLTKLNASRGLKAVINLGLSAIAGAVVVAIQASGAVDVGHVVISIGTTWIVSIASYYGLTAPTGVAPAVASATAGVGVGGAS